MRSSLAGRQRPERLARERSQDQRWLSCHRSRLARRVSVAGHCQAYGAICSATDLSRLCDCSHLLHLSFAGTYSTSIFPVKPGSNTRIDAHDRLLYLLSVHSRVVLFYLLLTLLFHNWAIAVFPILDDCVPGRSNIILCHLDHTFTSHATIFVLIIVGSRITHRFPMDLVVGQPVDHFVRLKVLVTLQHFVYLVDLTLGQVFLDGQQHCHRVLVVDAGDVYRAEQVLLVQILQYSVSHVRAILITHDRKLKVRVLPHIVFVAKLG